MRFLRFVFVVFVVGAFSSSALFANEEVQELNFLEDSIENPSLSQTLAYSRKPNSQENGRTYARFPSTACFQPSKSIFFQTNIGVGFLYFSGLRGNLMGQPVLNFAPANLYRDVPLKGRLSYNRTPLFEYLLGYRFNPWLKLALSYQHQGGITIQTKALSAHPLTAASLYVRFSSNLSLDALLAKVYFELPFAMVWKSLSINPYLAVGVGPSWQSWTRVSVSYLRVGPPFTEASLPLRQKISANTAWMADMGLCLQSASPANSFSVLAGCKYNQWGQARSIGKMSHQGAYKIALTQPLRIKTIYQFAPYLGVQWNFLPDRSAGSSYRLKGKSPKVWLPYWAASREFQCSRSIWTQFNVGIGFLYFSGLRGNLMGEPALDFLPNFNYRDIPLKGRLSYNRTPLLEYLLGYRFNNWLKLALSYQHQSGITVQSKVLQAFPTTGQSSTERGQFVSNLALDALLAKVYFELPFAMIWRSLSMNPYLSLGVGPGWQSWTRVQVNHLNGNTIFNEDSITLRQKISANAVWMADMGLRVQNASPNNSFSVLLGCRYNQWGQARSIGKMSQQGSKKIAITQPLRIKTVYQFAPYLGVQWNFSPDQSTGASYRLKGKNPKVWLPYWVASKEFQCPTSIWTQFNVGVGFLYFSGLKGNLMGQPVLDFSPELYWRDVPLKGRLSYNRTPLFEYLLGYQFNSWLKVALSYQYQGGILVETKQLHAFPPGGAARRSQYAQFESNLSLNAVLAKVYFELPFSMIWRSLSTNPYLAVGVGPGWQSWTSVNINFSAVTPVGAVGLYTDESLRLRQKISANAVWMVDMGLRVQSAYPNSKFSVLLGCKYNQWGQARNIGKMSQQGSLKLSITQPLRIKTVYQVAPYLGVQWNF